MSRDVIYLDHQASTPMHPAAAAALQGALLEHVANPHSSDHALGWGAGEAVEQARREISDAICADTDEVYFTSGATESDNIALLGLSGGRQPKRIVVSAIEHKAVLGPARELARRGCEIVIAPCKADGLIDLDALADIIDKRTDLVSLMLVNNEIGTVQPIAEVADMCRSAGALLHVDAAQAFGWMAIDVFGLGADMISLSGHKMGGPKGIGALYVSREVRPSLRPLLFGGDQEDGLRPGTLPVPLCVGFGAACRNLPSSTEVDAWRKRTREFERQLITSLPGTRINGAGAERHPGSISLTLPGMDADLFVAKLQPALAISQGSACTSGVVAPSHVLLAIGLSPEDCAATIRISTGRFTTADELRLAHERIIAAVQDVSDIVICAA